MSVETARMTTLRAQRDRAIAEKDAAIDDAVFLREEMERIALKMRRRHAVADLADELERVVSSTVRPRRRLS